MLVDGVDIGAFLAVDLHVDIQLVHHPGDGVVFETFMGHHVAPVTGGIAHRQQDRLVLFLRRRQRVGSPAVPVDGIVGVLQQVGAGFFGEAISGHTGLSDVWRMAGG